MKHAFKSITFGLGGTLLLLSGALFAPLAAHASADGRKNTTIALGAAAAYELLVRHQVAPALVLGAGAVYAGKRYEDALHHDRSNNRRDYHYDNNDHNYGDNNHNYGDGNRDNNNRNNDNNYSDRDSNDNYGDDNNYSGNTNNNRDYGRQGQRPSRDDYNQPGGGQNQQGRWNAQNNRQDQGQGRDYEDR